jgi:uncharacterized membrane protein YeaQ/YmgE (transglycosylase-associated protein family)
MAEFLWYLLIGGVAGWGAGRFMKDKSYGLIGNVLLGIVGGMIGGFAISILGFKSTTLIASLITAFIGACLLIFIVDRLKK